MPRLDILEKDEIARAWEIRKEKEVLPRLLRICLIAGPLLGLLAIFLVARIGDGEIFLTDILAILLIPPFIGVVFALSGYLSARARDRWEVTEKGIKIRGAKVAFARWSRIGTLSFRPIKDLPGYTRVSLYGKSRGVISPVFASIIVKGTEEELRSLLTENRD